MSQLIHNSEDKKKKKNMNNDHQTVCCETFPTPQQQDNRTRSMYH